MSLLRQIQAALMEKDEDIGPILLKLRFLASRLGSSPLELWVKHEAEGYPDDIEVPPYRKVGVSYKATFSGPLGSGIRDAPIPPYLIKEHAGQQWNLFEVRDSVATIDDLVNSTKDGNGSLMINSADLILALQGNVYEDYACNSVTGTVSKSAMVALQNAVRTKVLDLTIELEKLIPAAAEIIVGKPANDPTVKDVQTVTTITNQIVHGNVTTISNSGDNATIQLSIGAGDSDALIAALTEAGIDKADASELAEIVASENPESKEKPFGAKAKTWLGENIKKAVDGTWNVGLSVATNVLTEAVKKYYGLE